MMSTLDYLSEVFCFFFSSRRRHTRWTGDWSSDVCSSDLLGIVDARELATEHGTGGHRGELHAGEPHVDAELCGAVDLVGSIEPLRRRADQLEVLRVLEGDVA